MHNRSKALSNLTHSALLVQSRSFNKLWNLMTKRNQSNNFSKTCNPMFWPRTTPGPLWIVDIKQMYLWSLLWKTFFIYDIVYNHVIMIYFMTPTLGDQKRGKFFFANFVKRAIYPLGKISSIQKTDYKKKFTLGAKGGWKSNLCLVHIIKYTLLNKSDNVNQKYWLKGESRRLADGGGGRCTKHRLNQVKSPRHEIWPKFYTATGSDGRDQSHL